MKTRTSWRNQDRLWKLLAGDGPKSVEHEDDPHTTIDRIERYLSLPTISRADKTQLRKELEHQRRRIEVAKVLAQEESEGGGG